MTVQSFQQGQELLAAINALSIHLKLQAEGVSDPRNAEAARDSREKLDGFLQELEPLVGERDGNQVSPALGTSPRIRQLADRFVRARRDRGRFRSVLFREDITRARRLLYSEAEEDREPLLRCLEELRYLIQEHVQADASQMMGQV
ncbi:MAG: hypothetical protein M3P70_11910 [Actinomycetota bacterium]|nr:hypothetical protein [Actinomycetota bacterium]